jgi:Domain of unknown function (DUF4111)
VTLEDVPPVARAAWLDLRDRLQSILGDDLVAMWAHGGMTAAGDPAHSGDLDTYVVVRRRPDEATARRLEEAQRATAEAHGVEWDDWYVGVDRARRGDPPTHVWKQDRRDTTWAIQRAHWLAGRCLTLHGAEPQDIVPPPTWEDIESELDREVEHIERHVVEGDDDPYEATYAFLNGSRILRAIETHDVVISKHAAGVWALDNLLARWHDALRAALRTYEGVGTASDADVLAAGMAPFVSFVRDRMPTRARRPDAVPRWSGY